MAYKKKSFSKIIFGYKIFSFITLRIASYYLLLPFFFLVGFVIIVNIINLQEVGFFPIENFALFIENILGKKIFDKSSKSYNAMEFAKETGTFILFISLFFDSLLFLLRKITKLKLTIDRLRLSKYIITICIFFLLACGYYLIIRDEEGISIIGGIIFVTILISILGIITYHSTKMSFTIRSLTNK